MANAITYPAAEVAKTFTGIADTETRAKALQGWFKRLPLADKADLLAALLNDCDIAESDEGFDLIKAGERFHDFATGEVDHDAHIYRKVDARAALAREAA